MTSPLNPKNPAHARDNIPERGLRFPQPARHLDLDTREHGYALAYHVRRDLNLGPSAKVGPSLRGGMEGTRVRQDKNIRVAADNLTSPSHPGVDTEKALVRGQTRQDFSDAFGFFH